MGRLGDALDEFDGIQATAVQTPLSPGPSKLGAALDAFDAGTDPASLFVAPPLAQTAQLAQGFLDIPGEPQLPEIVSTDIPPETDIRGVSLPGPKFPKGTPKDIKVSSVVDKRIGFAESFKREVTGVKGLTKFPILGGIAGAAENVDLIQSANRLANPDFDYSKVFRGRVASISGDRPTFKFSKDIDQKRIAEFIKNLNEEQERGFTFGGKVAKGITALPTWMIEFAMTGGLASIGDDAATIAGRKLIGRYVKTKAGAAALKAAGITGGALVRATVGLPTRIAEQATGRQVLSDLQITEQEGWATSITKAWGDTVIEAASEETGEIISKGLGKAASKLIGKLPRGKKFLTELSKAWAKTTGGKEAEFVKKISTRAGYSNMIGEIGEERLATILREATGVSDREGNFVQRIAAGLQEDFTPSNLGVEAVTLAVPGAAKKIASKVINFRDIPVTDAEGQVLEPEPVEKPKKQVETLADIPKIEPTQPTEAKKPVQPTDIDIAPKAVEAKPEAVDEFAKGAKVREELLEKARKFDAEQGFTIEDVTPEGFGPEIREGEESVSRRPSLAFSTEQQLIRTEINEAKTLLKGDIAGDKRVAVEKRLKKAEDEFLSSLSEEQINILESQKLEQLPTPTAKIEKEIEDGKETIIEPATSFEVEQRKAGKPISAVETTGKLDPTDPKEALEITKRHAQWVDAEKGNPSIGGIFTTKFDTETREHVIDKIEYTPDQVDTAYRNVQKPVPSPVPDTNLFAMPGQEAKLEAIAAKMQKQKKFAAKKKGARIPGPRILPKAKANKKDHIKAVWAASATESTRFALNGVWVEGDTIVATDGRRMFWAKGKWGKDGLYINNASLKKGLLGKATKEGKFPRWRDIVPSTLREDAIEVNDLDKVWRHVHQASLLTSEDSKGITILVNTNGELGFASASPEIGHSEVNVFEGAKILGGVNPQFLLDTIRFHATRGDGGFKFYFPNHERPMLSESFDGKTFTVIMPVNIDIEPSEALKEEIAGEIRKPKGGGASGASVASAKAPGKGFGTIATSEKSEAKAAKFSARITEPEKTTNALKEVVGKTTDEVLKMASPAHRTPESKRAAQIIRKNIAKLARDKELAAEQLRKAHTKFVFMSKDKMLDFIDRMETGKKQPTPALEKVSQDMRKLLDDRRAAVQGLGKGKLEHYFENYFPHLWKDPKKSKSVIGGILSRRPLEGRKSFLKQRTIMTVKEGVEAGLELVSDNPVDLVLLKVHEMDRYVAAQRIIGDLRERSLVQFVYARSQAPEGMREIKDNLFTVFAPPEMTKKEAFDSVLIDNLMSIARSMNIDTKRFVNIGGKRWGFAQWGTGGDKIRTKHAGPESVLAHEIGHILGVRYNMYSRLRRAGEGTTKTITRGKRKGEGRFVPTEEALAHRKVIDKEWRALADARFAGAGTTEGYKKYVRKAREKEAVMLEALVHAPHVFKKEAPTLFKAFKKFLNETPELRPMLDLKTSLVLGEAEAKIKIPGYTVLGKFYAPEPVARLLNNYLSPGLRNSDYGVIATPYNLLRQAGNVLNQANLALSFFHGFNISTDTVGSQVGLGLRQIMATKGQVLSGMFNILTAPGSPIINLFRGAKLRKSYLTELDKINNPVQKQLVTALIEAGGRARMDNFYYNQAIKALGQTFSELVRGSMGTKAKAAAKLPFVTFGAGLELAAKPLMEWMVPRGKLGLFSIMAQSEMKRADKENLTADQLKLNLTKVWDSVDNRMGQLVYDNLFWNKTLKESLMLAIRSVGWNLGSWREFGGAPIDIITTPKRLQEGDAWMSHKMAYVMSQAVMYAIMGAVFMKIMTGDDPEELKDYYFPKTGNKNADGSDERLSLPTYAKDVFAYSTRPFRTIKNKVHPIWGLMSDTWQNKDFFGVEIRHKDDPVIKQMLDLAKFVGKNFIPFAVRNYQKMTKAGTEPTKAGITSITGVTSAPSYLTRTPAQALSTDYMVARIPDSSQTRSEFEKKQLKKTIKAQIRRGESFDMDAALLTFTDKELDRILREAKISYFAESVKRLSFTEAMDVFAISSNKEKLEIFDILRGKRNRAKNKTPDQEAYYRELTQ